MIVVIHSTACDSPPVINNAVVTYSEIIVGGQTTYTCTGNYQMIGNPNIACTAEGTWTTVEFECKSMSALIICSTDLIYLVKVHVFEKKPLEYNLQSITISCLTPSPRLNECVT